LIYIVSSLKYTRVSARNFLSSHGGSENVIEGKVRSLRNVALDNIFL